MIEIHFRDQESEENTLLRFEKEYFLNKKEDIRNIIIEGTETFKQNLIKAKEKES